MDNNCVYTPLYVDAYDGKDVLWALVHGGIWNVGMHLSSHDKHGCNIKLLNTRLSHREAKVLMPWIFNMYD